ncbi:MAG: fibronectin type III domain-containing protein [Acidimicrobiales bacterium]
MNLRSVVIHRRRQLLPKLLLFAVMVSATAAVPSPASSAAAADTARPETVIDTPTPRQAYAAGETVTVSGTASDNQNVARVRLTIYDRNGFATWNGSAFTAAYSTIDATLNPTTANPNKSWTYDFTPPPGSYVLTARAFDSAGNYDTTLSWPTFTVSDSLPDRLNPVSNLQVTATTQTSVTVSWSADDDPRRRAFDFFVNNQYVTFIRDGDATSHTFAGLEPSTTYQLGVTAVGDPNGDWPAQHFSRRINIGASTDNSSETVVWEDNFDSLDLNHWKVEHSTYGDGNNELQCYKPSNVSVSGGKLVLRAMHETYTCPNGSTRQVTSGMVRSRGVTFSPGQAIEFRVKLTPADPNDQAGLWPAVWASGWGGGGWPRGGELDWLEVMTANNPKRSIFSAHYMNTAGNHAKNGQPVFGDENFSDSWHVVRFDYGVDGNLAWHLDGELVHTITDLPTIQGYPAPFDSAIGEIKVNLALGGSPGPLAPAALGTQGATFEMDYIRILNL